MDKCVKDKQNYYQKYRRYYIGQFLLLVGWITNFILFSRFYEGAMFYVDKNAKFIIQLLFIVNYYLRDVLTYLFVSFLLMTFNLFLLLMFYTKNKREGVKQKERIYAIIVCLAIIGINALTLALTILWPLFCLLFVLSLTIIYIIYVITKSLYEEKNEGYEEGELVKVEGPFETKATAEAYTEEFLTHWTDYFAKKGYTLVSFIKHDEENEWYVEIIIQSIQ